MTAPTEVPGASVRTPKQASLARKASVLIGFALLVSFALLRVPQVAAHPHAQMVMLITSAALSAMFLYFVVGQLGGQDPARVEVNVKKTHFVQAFVQGSVYVYAGMYWDGIAQWAPFIAYQLIVAFVFDFLLSVFRGKPYKLGFSVFPIVFSINLFMWFKPEYFEGQIAMIVGAVLIKAFVVRKTAEGPRHIFNPSALPMAITAILVVIMLNREYMLSTNNLVASYLIPPHMQLMVFSVGILSFLASGVAFIPLGTVATLFIVDRVFRAVTGLPPMGDIIHPSVFIGITLLVTDPMTSPKNRTGQLIYGCLYGLGIVGFYILLQRFGYPTYYDKILPVPILNYLAPYIERIRVPLAGPMKSRVWQKTWAPLMVYVPVFLLLVPTIEKNFMRRTYFLEKEPSLRTARPERRQPVDPQIGSLINQRIIRECQDDPTLDACRLIR